ncbi:MAG: hypothetical protein V1899_10140 [Planctomycetota bacterium]
MLFQNICRRAELRIVAALALVSLTACQEIRGPVWSPDGKRLAFTTYTANPTSTFDTGLYTLETDDENAEPELVAKAAAFPCWGTDSQTIYYLGDRDTQGFYTKIFKRKAGVAPQAVLSNLRVTNLQMTADAMLGLLCTGQSARPGSPVTIKLWNPADGKLTELSQLGEIYSPALMPNGKVIAYAQKPTAELPLLCICKLDGSRPEAVFPTETEKEPNATTYIIHAFPDNDRFLFYSPGGAALWTIRRDGTNIRRYALPEGLSSPIMVAFDENANSASVTLTQAAAEKVLYQVYRVAFDKKTFTRLDGDSAELLGGHVLDPRAIRRKGPIRYAWLSAAGLTVGEPGKARYYPMSAAQCIAASAFQIKQGESQKAVQSVMKARELQLPSENLNELDKAEARAYLADKQPDNAADAFERSALLFPIGSDGLKFIFPASTGLPRPAPAEMAAALKEMDDLIKALPDNRLLPLLKQALAAREQGNQRQALDFYRQAVPILPDQARLGGVRFLEAMCAFELCDLQLAAEKWEAAARSADFPQASYAAGLSAIAYLLTERPENVAKANTVLQLTVARNSPLANEFSQLTGWLRGKAFVERAHSQETVSADGRMRCWVDYETYYLPLAGPAPVRVSDRDGKVTERRIGVRSVTTSSIWVVGNQQPIFRIPCRISVPVIAPNATALAFSAHGEVFPLSNNFCEVYVIDTRGKLLLGDIKATFTGQVMSRYIVKTIVWNGPQNVTVTGSEVDVFGAETTFSKTLTVAAHVVEPVKP